jgi:hypothetical protein
MMRMIHTDAHVCVYTQAAPATLALFVYTRKRCEAVSVHPYCTQYKCALAEARSV